MAIQDKCKGFGTLSYLLKKCLVEKHLPCLYDDINLADLAHRPRGWKGQHHRHPPADAVGNDQTGLISEQQIANPI